MRRENYILTDTISPQIWFLIEYRKKKNQQKKTKKEKEEKKKRKKIKKSKNHSMLENYLSDAIIFRLLNYTSNILSTNLYRPLFPG